MTDGRDLIVNLGNARYFKYAGWSTSGPIFATDLWWWQPFVVVVVVVVTSELIIHNEAMADSVLTRAIEWRVAIGRVVTCFCLAEKQ